MKFSQVGDGQQFKFQGVIYTRKGPLMAVDKEGNSKMIARSADVNIISREVTGTKTEPDLQQSITLEHAMHAFKIFEEAFEHCMGDEADVQECIRKAGAIYKSSLIGD